MQKPMMMTVLAALLCASAGCPSGGAKQTRRLDDLDEFACKDRRATYIMVGGFVAAEYGLMVDCTDEAQTLLKWTADNYGERTETEHALAQSQFEELWRNLEDAGWKNLDDCENPQAKSDDQIYTFEVSDGEKTVTITCQGKELPFPYDRVVNSFDMLAAQFN